MVFKKMNTTTEKMLKNKELKNGVLNYVIDALVSWNDCSTQSKLELDPIEMINYRIGSNLPGYFDDFQFYYITNKFNSSDDFLNNFYKANPEIGTVVRAILQYPVKPIKLILDGKKLDKSLDYYYKIFNDSLEVLKRLVK